MLAFLSRFHSVTTIIRTGKSLERINRNFSIRINMTSNPKYAKALELFRNTDLARKEICAICKLNVSAFSAYLEKYHRDLILDKISKGLDLVISPNTKLYGKSGQGVLTKAKYRDAILACRNIDFIEYSISHIARYFKLNPSGLGNQLRAHYPDILEWRYNEQLSRGISTYQQNTLKEESSAQYAEALEMFRSSNKTIKEVAELCNVSFTGFRQHILFYHKDLVRKRKITRQHNTGQKYKGKKTGSNTIHEPQSDTVKKYAEALEIYRTTSLTIKEIAKRLSVPYGGFYGYIRTWHRDLIVKRRGIKCKEDVEISDLNTYKHYVASTSSKYKEAIKYLKSHDITTAAAARKYSLHPESFRQYLKEHEPRLVSTRGMMTTPDGKYVSRRSYEKYQDAILVYRNTSESLTSIAKRYKVNPISLRGFIRRNYPEYIVLHKRAIKEVENDRT